MDCEYSLMLIFDLKNEMCDLYLLGVGSWPCAMWPWP